MFSFVQRIYNKFKWSPPLFSMVVNISLLIYKDKYICNKYPQVVFLCGNKFVEQEKNDKRSILKEYIEENAADFYSIILEENFMFKNTTKSYLSYDDIFLKNLFQVEQLASIFADKIIIVHETLSTAAELGMFAHNEAMMKKICLLVPDSMSIEENKTTAFIKLAYLNTNTPKMQIGKKIIYYPDIDVNRTSKYKSDYRTEFHNNEIGKNLGCKILRFISSGTSNPQITFKRNDYNEPYTYTNCITYKINTKAHNITAYVNPYILKTQLLSLFFVDEFKKEIRNEKRIFEHVNYIDEFYHNIILNTVCHIEGLKVNEFNINIKLSGTSCTLNQAIGYFIYMLQGIKLLYLESESESADASIRKIRISNKFKKYTLSLGEYIEDFKITSFGRLGI